MENVRGHFAAFLAFKAENQRHIIIFTFWNSTTLVLMDFL